MEVQGKYYNIEKLIENTNENIVFIHNLIEIFIKNNQVDNFSKLLEKKDFSNLTSQLHKIKSNQTYPISHNLILLIKFLIFIYWHSTKKKRNSKLSSLSLLVI